jgi:hypothetical protein
MSGEIIYDGPDLDGVSLGTINGIHALPGSARQAGSVTFDRRIAIPYRAAQYGKQYQALEAVAQYPIVIASLPLTRAAASSASSERS